MRWKHPPPVPLLRTHHRPNCQRPRQEIGEKNSLKWWRLQRPSPVVCCFNPPDALSVHLDAGAIGRPKSWQARFLEDGWALGRLLSLHRLMKEEHRNKLKGIPMIPRVIHTHDVERTLLLFGPTTPPAARAMAETLALATALTRSSSQALSSVFHRSMPSSPTTCRAVEFRGPGRNL